MRSFDVSQKVWVGGLTDAVTWKALQELADTVEEAQTAIATLNGSSAGDIVLQFDVWTKKEK